LLCFNPPYYGRVDETKPARQRLSDTVLAFNPPYYGRVDETAPAETLVYKS